VKPRKAKPKTQASKPTPKKPPARKKPKIFRPLVEYAPEQAIRVLTSKKPFGGHTVTPVTALRCAPEDPGEELTKLVCLLIGAGAYPSVALRALGVGEGKARTWVERGMQDPESPCGKFLRAIDAAEARAEILDVAQINLGVRHWQALAWVRERRSAKRWAARYIDDAELRPTVQPQPTVPDYDQLAQVLSILHDAGALALPADASETIIDVPNSKGSPNGKSTNTNNATA
jgi:hypothetical protein